MVYVYVSYPVLRHLEYTREKVNMQFNATWKNLESNMLGKVTKRDRMICHMWNIKERSMEMNVQR